MSAFLIVRLGSLGDVVHGIPVAAALRARFPDARIDWLVDPRYTELLDLVACVDRAIAVDPRHDVRGGARRLRGVVGELRRVGYDAVIDLQGLVKSAVLARLAGGRRTIGFPRANLREPAARVFYTDTPRPEPAAHVIRRNLGLLTVLGITDASIAFPLRQVRSAIADDVQSRLTKYVVINPGAAWPNKRWPAERFGALAASLRDRGLRSVVLWGPGERPLADAVVAASAGAADAAPDTGIMDILALARAAALFISGDTGPLHLAAAVGTPVVALFGPTQAERNGPWCERDISLTRWADCACHYERRCRRPTPCIDDIAITEVVEAAMRRLETA